GKSPFTPMMAARIRPSLDDDTILHRISLDPFIDPPTACGNIVRAGDNTLHRRAISEEEPEPRERQLRRLF
ncbi:hypothetical protein VIGAN_08039200, partial [Vigna angularis var. angularis]